LNLAESGSSGPIEDVSEDFSKMNRGQEDVLTESGRIRRPETQLTELDAEGYHKERKGYSDQ
jgi:hypothetical protein